MQAGKKNKAVEFLSNAEAHGLLALASCCILGEMGCGTGSVVWCVCYAPMDLRSLVVIAVMLRGHRTAHPLCSLVRNRIREERTRLMRDGKLWVGWALEERPRGKRIILSSKSKVRLIFLGTPGDGAGELC